MIHAKTKLFHFIPNKTLGSDAGAVSSVIFLVCRHALTIIDYKNIAGLF